MKQVTTMNQVTSTDGATISFARQGSGDPVLLVPGFTGKGESWAQVVPHLQSRFTVVTIDRRGRGASTDGDAEYSLDREAADVAAVVEAIGGEVHVAGWSTGATVALLAATWSPSVRSLALYEPQRAPQHWPAGFPDRLEALVRAGDPAAAAEYCLSSMSKMGIFTPEEVEAIKGSPAWERVVAAMPAMPREIRASLAAAPLDLDAVSRISVPVLLLIGELTTAPLLFDGLDELDRVLPDVRRATIPGQRHMAVAFAPEVFAEFVESFLVSLEQGSRKPGSSSASQIA